MERAFLGLGANLGEPQVMLAEAIARLAAPDLEVVARAPLYRTAPIGPPGQPDYLNTVLEIRTDLRPEPLLDRLKALEQNLGRTPGVRWGPRLIDLDLLLYGTEQIDLPRLRVPHAELHRRRFVLAPLADLAPEVQVPGLGRSVRELLIALGDDPAAVARLDRAPS